MRRIDYNAIGKASYIRSEGTEAASGRSAGETRFTYDGSRNQVRRHSTEQGKTSTIIQQGGTELIMEGGERRYRRNLGNAIVERSGDSITTRYVYTDHLGSVDVITNAIGQLIEKLSFDAFGKRRAVFTQGGQSIALNLSTLLAITHQGFTGHQQVDHAGIVQMGGRIYDAHIGRFLQADPFVQSPSNSQNFNRYSYVLNNPLSYTDPSGYIFKSIKKHWRTIVAVGLTIVAPWGTGLWATIATGALSGYIATGSLKGALVGAFSAGMFYGIGSAMPGGSFGSGAHLGKTVAHGVAGGISSVLSGGKFGHGFASAGFAQFGAPAIDQIGGRIGDTVSGSYFDTANRAKRIVSAAVVGGTASSLAGGKFANGAITAAFSRGFNDEAHFQAERKKLLDRWTSFATVEETRFQPVFNDQGIHITEIQTTASGWESLDGIGELAKVARKSLRFLAVDLHYENREVFGLYQEESRFVRYKVENGHSIPIHKGPWSPTNAEPVWQPLRPASNPRPITDIRGCFFHCPHGTRGVFGK
ncbi:RHS repeat-associated core domain-containing protein [Alkalimonas mucilaginosa]|uniref:RHS repeat-associated core domain-containing protein n=1 Tax=Alkalimonas mucilaginosa TaxID=3057676 RepID=A0ABU7JC43_9GAMM|nr:RHS repeat-associated core domain-containing protein [Alkalimonas sp. MEB004]MEE2023263.1 RHS repeat-associated core domain-containing protein [Alkalimonas sp. MEB004]